MNTIVAACRGYQPNFECLKKDNCKRFLKYQQLVINQNSRASYYIIPEACINNQNKYYIYASITNNTRLRKIS